MDDNVRRQIAYEKEKMERDLKKVENYNPPKPEKSHVFRYIAHGLKVVGYSLIATIVLEIPDLIFDLAPIGSFIAVLPLTFGIVIAIFMVIGWCYSDYEDMKKWEKETSPQYKKEEIAKVKRKYETRIHNLECYGKYKKPDAHFPDKICLNCGSEHIITSPPTYSSYSPLAALEHKTVKCLDCGYTELY